MLPRRLRKLFLPVSAWLPLLVLQPHLTRHPKYPGLGHYHRRPRAPLDVGVWRSEASPALSSEATEGSSRALRLSGRTDTVTATPRPPAPLHPGGGRAVCPWDDGGTSLCWGAQTNAG